jgi:hypothetical protein
MKKVFMMICLAVFVLGGTIFGDTNVNTQQGQSQNQDQLLQGNGNTANNNQVFDPTLISNSKYRTSPIMVGLPPLIFDFPENRGTFDSTDFCGDLQDLEGEFTQENFNYMLENTGQSWAQFKKGFEIRKCVYKKYSARTSVLRYFDVYRNEVVNKNDWKDRRTYYKEQGYICIGSVSVKAKSGYMTEHALGVATQTAAELGADVVFFRIGSKPIHHGGSVGIGTAPVVSSGGDVTVGTTLGAVSGSAEVLHEQGASITMYRKMKEGEVIQVSPTPQIKPEENKNGGSDKDSTLKDAVKASSKAIVPAEEKPVVKKIAKTVG